MALGLSSAGDKNLMTGIFRPKVGKIWWMKKKARDCVSFTIHHSFWSDKVEKIVMLHVYKCITNRRCEKYV